MAMPSDDIYIGLGSNLDRPELQITKALKFLANSNYVSLDDHSSFYITAPIGYDDQPYFINAVAKLQTKLKPLYLLRLLQSIENKQFRKRSSNQNAPRTLDLDILIYGRLQCITDTLSIPHPRMLERRFVLEPLLEIASNLIIPGRGYAANYFTQVADQECQRSEQILL